MSGSVQVGSLPLVGRVEQVITTVLLWFLALVTLMPLVLIAAKALQPATGDGGHVTFGNLHRAWVQGDFTNVFRSSVIVTLSVVVISTSLSTLAGYALAIIRPRGFRIVFALFVVGIIIPFEGLIIPLYFRLQSVGLTDTYWALILPQSALAVAFGTYWMRGFFLNIPTSILEAGRVEGASSLVILWHVILPMGRSAIGTLAILSFMWNWNEFLMPLVMIASDRLHTAPLALATFQSRYGADQTAQAAAALIIAAPILVLYVLLNRRVIAGVTGGSTR